MDRCPACGGKVIIDYERGEMVCTQCGLVVAESIVDVGPEWRPSEKTERARAAPFKLRLR